MSFYFTSEPFVTFDDIARVFDDALTPTTSSQAVKRHAHAQKTIRPRLDVHEGPDNTYVASFELPGLKKEDVSIELHNNTLTISGESKSTSSFSTPSPTPDATPSTDPSTEKTVATPAPSATPKYFVRERRFGKFARTIELPEGTKPESVRASVADGVLTVVFPRAAPEQAPKRIDIQ